MTRPVVLLTDDSIHPDAVALLRQTCEVRIAGAYAAEATMVEAVRDVSAILVRLGTISAPVIAAAPGLRIVACHGSGVDDVDLDAATAAGVVVTNAGAAKGAIQRCGE